MRPAVCTGCFAPLPCPCRFGRSRPRTLAAIAAEAAAARARQVAACRAIQAAAAARPVATTCGHCGRSLRDPHPLQRYCDARCTKAASNQRHAQRRRRAPVEVAA